MTSTDTKARASEQELAASQKRAQALADRLQGKVEQATKKGLKEELKDDADKTDVRVTEFVHTKEARVFHRKWAAKQAADGNLPRPTSGQRLPWHLRVIIMLCSTLGLLLFAHRMYQKHFAKPQGASVPYLLYTPGQLAKHGADENSSDIRMAILGEVYEVTSAKQYYGKGGGYAFFTGRDASRAFATGKFDQDLNDNVEDFTDAQMAGLVHWKEFYLKEYAYRGRVIGAFFDDDGVPTEMLRRVMAGAAREKAAAKEREGKRLDYPNCNKRWSQTKGSEVWCEEEMYPRLLTEMINGVAEQRCACFKEMGWSNLRSIYPGCKPAEHRCTVSKPEQQDVGKDEL